MKRRDFLKLMGLSPLLLASLKFSQNKAKITNSPDKNLPNILILVLDTLSARHMSLYGYPRDTTPHMKRFAEQATVYHRHYANGNYTTTGTASLLSGMYPWTHGAIHLGDSVHKKFTDRNIFAQLRKSYYTFSYTHNPMAYILSFAKLPIPEWCEGEILPNKQASGNYWDNSDRRVFVVEAKVNPGTMPLRKATLAMVKDQYKLIHYRGYKGHSDVWELNNLTDDPEELRNTYDPSNPETGSTINEFRTSLANLENFH